MKTYEETEFYTEEEYLHFTTPKTFEQTIKASLLPYTGRLNLSESKEFRDSIISWNTQSYNHASKVGSMMNIMNTLPKTMTRPEWENHYGADILGWEKMVTLINGFAEKENIDFMTAVNFWWIRIVDQTFTGWESETAVFNIVTAEAALKGYSTRPATAFEDLKCGVDMVIMNGETVISGLQIKGKRYFSSNRATVVQARTQYNPKKYAKFTAEHNAPVFYCVIEETISTGKAVYKPTYKGEIK